MLHHPTVACGMFQEKCGAEALRMAHRDKRGAKGRRSGARRGLRVSKANSEAPPVYQVIRDFVWPHSTSSKLQPNRPSRKQNNPSVDPVWHGFFVLRPRKPVVLLCCLCLGQENHRFYFVFQCLGQENQWFYCVWGRLGQENQWFYCVLGRLGNENQWFYCVLGA